MMSKKWLILVALTTTLNAQDRETKPIDYEKAVFESRFKTFSHTEIYEQVVGFEIDNEIILENNVEICLDDDCIIYNHHGDGAEIFQIQLAKKGVPTKGGKGAKSVKDILKTVSKGVSAGGRVRVNSIKVNVDGSFEIKGLDIQFGAGFGADAPIPGQENGKQTQHY